MADHLAAAGQGALDRGDFNAGRALLRRAAAALPSGDERRLALAPDLFEALSASEHREEARAVLEEARGAADPVVRAIVAILETSVELEFLGATRGSSDERRARREEARAILEQAGHDDGLSLLWWSVALEAWIRCWTADCVDASERSVRHAELAGVERRVQESKHRICSCYVIGPTPVVEAIERVEAIRAGAPDAILLGASASGNLGRLLSMQGELEEARELVRRAHATYRDAGRLVLPGGMSMWEAWVEWRAGDQEAEERVLRAGLEELERLGGHAFSPTVALLLADLVYSQGRLDEAERLCAWARERTGADDLINFVELDGLEGGLLARRGSHEEAGERARRAVELAKTPDFYEARAWARLMLVETLALAGRMGEASEEAVVGLAHFDAKGDVTGAARAQERLVTVGIDVG